MASVCLPGVLPRKAAWVAPPAGVRGADLATAVGLAESCPGGWLSGPALGKHVPLRLGCT